jgi:hypothetical protein
VRYEVGDLYQGELPGHPVRPSLEPGILKQFKLREAAGMIRSRSIAVIFEQIRGVSELLMYGENQPITKIHPASQKILVGRACSHV